MADSKFIAGLVGPTLLALGASVLINRIYLSGIVAAFARDSGLILLSGLILMVAGLAIIQTHGIWSGWPAIITALGWLALIGGGVRVLGFSAGPDIARVLGPELLLVAGGAMVAIGAFLTFKAFISKE